MDLVIFTEPLSLSQQRYISIKYYISSPPSFLQIGKNVNINNDTIIWVTTIIYTTPTYFN